ncbi:hypothetical protein [Kribbella sp. NPDC049584]|uniref:hypothetical protein n=1 Tax=Kribbella sp. NPDC049584 TaxID=3154833 RepID=UPI00341C8560
MEDDDWVPLSVREGREAAELYEGPFEGVPNHLQRALFSFYTDAASDLRSRIQLKLRLNGPPVGPENLLNAVDAALRLGSPDDFYGGDGLHPIDRLERDLGMGGSVYRVGESGLERRVDETAIAMFEASLSSARAVHTPSGSAAKHLAEAWSKTYGIDPEPPVAVLLAVKAVEDVAVPLVIPNDRQGTLGKVINALKAEDKWEFLPGRDRSIVPVRELAQFIWAAPLDRHPGTSDYSQTTLEQAEAIVHAAVVLVRWFAEKQIARKPGQS